MPVAPPSDEVRATLNLRLLAVLLGGLAVLALPAVVVAIESEAVTAGLAVRAGATLTLLGALAALSAIDIETRRLPDLLTLPLAALGLAVAPVLLGTALAWHVAAAALGFVALWLVARLYLAARGRPGMGLGDAKLLAAGGAWVGLDALPAVLLAASLSGLAVVLVARWRGAEVRAETALPFGPFLALGIWLAWLYGPWP